MHFEPLMSAEDEIAWKPRGMLEDILSTNFFIEE